MLVEGHVALSRFQSGDFPPLRPKISRSIRVTSARVRNMDHKIKSIAGEKLVCGCRVLANHRKFCRVHVEQCFNNRTDTSEDGASAVRAPSLDLYVLGVW